MKKLVALVVLLFAMNARAGDLKLGVFEATPPPPGQQEPASRHDSTNNLTVPTICILSSIAIGLILYDVLLSVKHESTESQVITTYAWRYSSIPFILGILIGHWLFTHESQWNMNVWPLAAVAMGAVIAWDISKLNKSTDHSWTRYPGLWFAIGIPVGALLWSQRH